MRANQFIERYRNATTHEEVLRLLQEALRDLGIEHTIISLLTITVLSGLPGYSLLQNDPDDRQEETTQQEYKSLTPFQRVAATSSSRDYGTRWSGSEVIQTGEGHNGQPFQIRIPCEERGGTLITVILQSDRAIVLDADALHHLNLVVRQFNRARGPMDGKAQYADRISLSSREQEILQWCSQGKSRDRISSILGISRNTVDFHLRNIFRKLDTSNITVAVVKALQHGLIHVQ